MAMKYGILTPTGAAMRRQDGVAEFESESAAEAYLKSLGINAEKITQYTIMKSSVK